MTRSERLRLALAAALAAGLALSGAPARAAAPRLLDNSRLIVLENGTPAGYEEFAYEIREDSLVVSGVHQRTVRKPDGATAKWAKVFSLVVDERDFGLRGYLSKLDFDGHKTVRRVEPGDTSITVYTEIDGGGEGTALTRPPGRLFILDPMLFTLFDVICRNLSARALAKRPLELVTLGERPGTVRATATAAGPDTIRWGGERVISRRYVISDGRNTFVAWVSPEGRMLRLVHEGGALEVLREEPKPAR